MEFMGMKKIFYLIMVALFVLGVVGGFGYTVYYGEYVISVGILACGYMGLPRLAEYVKALME